MSSLPAAYAAAQHALAAQVWSQGAENAAANRGPAGRLDTHPGRDHAWREPAQPPASVSVTWHGDTATVSDPRYGWLHVDSDDLAAALTLRTDDLLRALRPLNLGVDGNEPPATLAALAALHLPDLPTIHTSAPPRPPSPAPSPSAPSPAAPPPPAPSAAAPPPTGPDLDGPP
ncbi:conserved hypothetical protein [Frankia canadensis]|uniref:Uncharacterized protein n=1 Tax=Frankia canadensis TaxID=1836972 RepID=A0A2I2KVN1_9ACTN|nr:conserved hypothetical protein [Frankia canadensis]SOU57010.1 conserved hypothetical protein [Frankia canadensis]